MIIYKDLITEAELLSDGWDLELVDGVVYEANCRRKTVGGETFDTGANPSAEEGGDEGTDETKETVIDVVHDFSLQETQFDKKSYLKYLKSYMGAVEEKLKENKASDDEIAAFKKGAGIYAKKIVANFKDYEFFMGPVFHEKEQHMIILLNYREDGTTPYVILWKHGLKAEKV